MKHRKLFPIPRTNQSMVCPDACDPSCPDGCYSFSDYFFPPPLPPPPPSPPPVSAKHGVSISPYVVIIATLLGLTLLIITYYVVIVKNCAGWGCFRRRRQQEITEEGFLDENHGVGIDHPIWYIRTIGLQPSVINSITVFKYKKGDSLIEGTDCSVCLTEFQDDEILRLLPKCNHAFHIPCIDTWLRSHTNCPVCRAGIVSSAVSTTPMAPDEDNQVENTEITVDQGAQDNQEGSGGEVEDGVEFPESAENAASWVIDDLEENSKVKNAMHQVKRSVSADSLVIAKIRQAMESLAVSEFEAPELNGPNKSGMHQRNNDATIAQPSNQKDITVKRSVSYGGRSFLSRNSRNPNSILPP